jgi:hypothetical protein
MTAVQIAVAFAPIVEIAISFAHAMHVAEIRPTEVAHIARAYTR